MEHREWSNRSSLTPPSPQPPPFDGTDSTYLKGVEPSHLGLSIPNSNESPGWEFLEDASLPNPRSFIGGRKWYRVGGAHSGTLNLHRLSMNMDEKDKGGMIENSNPRLDLAGVFSDSSISKASGASTLAALVASQGITRASGASGRVEVETRLSQFLSPARRERGTSEPPPPLPPPPPPPPPPPRRKDWSKSQDTKDNETQSVQVPRPNSEEIRASQRMTYARSVYNETQDPIATLHNIPPAFAQIHSGLTELLGNLFDAKEGSYDEESFQSTDDWFIELSRKTQPLLEPLRRNRVPRRYRVKIAILDTGIDTRNDAFTMMGGLKQIREIEDFLDPAGNGFDEYGHGTHCTGLLLKVAPEADIYIARVVKDRDSGIDPAVVAKAINRACSDGIDEDGTSNWNVDIITMSFGFSKREEIVDKALRKAFFHNKVVLAAASNNGTRRTMAFPASQFTVIAVNSAGGDGNPSTFNPGVEGRDGKNLTIIGEHVESAWRCGPESAKEVATNCTRRMSGTSVATPIAAGIIALVLELAYQSKYNPGEGHSDDIFERLMTQGLSTHDSMFAVLKLMSKKTGDYRNIVPWSLLNVKYARAGVGGHIEKFLVDNVAEG